MAKKKSSSQAWLKEHRDDLYVQRAQRRAIAREPVTNCWNCRKKTGLFALV